MVIDCTLMLRYHEAKYIHIHIQSLLQKRLFILTLPLLQMLALPLQLDGITFRLKKYFAFVIGGFYGFLEM